MTEAEQKQLHYFESEIKKLNSVFSLYKGLFTDDNVIKSMNQISPSSFVIIQSGLEVLMLLSISKLADKKEQGRGKNIHENLSIERVIDIAQRNNWSNLEKVGKLITQFIGDVNNDPFRKIRNTQEAHIKLEVGLGKEKPPEVFLNDLQEKIDLLTDIMLQFPNPNNFIYPEDHYKLSDFLFEKLHTN